VLRLHVSKYSYVFILTSRNAICSTHLKLLDVIALMDCGEVFHPSCRPFLSCPHTPLITPLSDILTRIRGCGYRRGMDWWMDLLTTYTHHSEQVITAPLLISTIYKSPQHPFSIFFASCVLTSRSLTTAPNSRNSWASCSQIMSQLPVRNSCQFPRDTCQLSTAL
jgi:hypothetical protein